MAVLFDVATTAVAYVATGTQITSHAASASARAAVVLIEQNASATDQVTGVTYGSVAMVEIVSVSEATEPGVVSIWWLDDIAPGTQNVAMTTNGTANKQLVVATMTAATGNKVVVASQNSGTSASVANPSWDLTGLTALDGTALMCFEVVHSGLTSMTTTPHAGWTLISNTDLGAQGRGYAYENIAPAAGIIGCGWVAATADDFVGASVAFTEVALPVPHTLGGGSLNVWINATDLPGIDGSSVTSITESSPTARVLNVVSGTAPILRKTAGPNGAPILDHTAGAGGLHSAIGGTATPNGNLTYFMVVQNFSAAEQEVLQGHIHYEPTVQIYQNKLNFLSAGVANLASSSLDLGAGWRLVVITFTAATQSTHFDIDSLTQDASLGGAQTFTADQGVSYGENIGNAANFTGKMAEIGLYSSVLSAGDITTLRNYLKAKYALSDVVVPTAPSAPVMASGEEFVQAAMPSTLPSGATSFSLYEDGVLFNGGWGINALVQTNYRDPTIAHSYTLRAVGPGGISVDSSAVSSTASPGAPTGITVTPGETSVTVRWNAKTYAATYKVKRNGLVVASLSAGETVFIDTGLSPVTQYGYAVSTTVSIPTLRESSLPAAITCFTIIAHLFLSAGGPSLTECREDMVAFKPIGAPNLTPMHHVRQSSAPWSMAERVFAGVEFFPAMWLTLLAASEITYYLENLDIPGPSNNFRPQFPYAGCWYPNAHGYAVWLLAGGQTNASVVMHETGHHVNHALRPMVGLHAMIGDTPGDAVDDLAATVLASSRAMDVANNLNTYQSTNSDELVAESYRTLLIENADPGWLAFPVNAIWPAGVRADEWFLTICRGDASLAASWRAEMTRPEIWPASPWPVRRTMATQPAIDARRNTLDGGIKIQNLDSNEGPTLLLADATNGYRTATNSPSTYMTAGWTRSDRPLVVPVNPSLYPTTESGTVEIKNLYVSDGVDCIPPYTLLGGPSERWRVTVTFRLGAIVAGKSCLWSAKETIDGIETEYDISWTGAALSASLTTRSGTGGAVLATTTVSSAGILVAGGERTTVQAVWGAQGSGIMLRHRTASANVVTELTSPAMPVSRAAVSRWSMPVPHAPSNWTPLAAIAVETVHDGGVGPFTWMDAEYA